MARHESSFSLALLVQQSLFDRVTGLVYRTRMIVPVSVVLLLLPVAVAFVEGLLGEILSSGLWRPLFIQPTIIIYVLLIAPFIQRAHVRVIESLQPIIQMSLEELSLVLNEQSRRFRRGEAVALLVGAIVGVVLCAGMTANLHTPWLLAYQIVSTIAVYAVLAWVIYGTMAGTQLTGALLRQQLDVDILDIRPFEPIGRASLLESMTFIVGATLAMVFAITDDWILDLPNLIAYAFFAGISILVFILDMRDTHRILASAKQRELDVARSRVAQAYHAVKGKALQGESIQSAVAEMNAWIACRERLEQARTWPYSVDMIRKLLISSLLPVGVAAIRQWGTALFSMIKLPF